MHKLAYFRKCLSLSAIIISVICMSKMVYAASDSTYYCPSVVTCTTSSSSSCKITNPGVGSWSNALMVGYGKMEPGDFKFGLAQFDSTGYANCYLYSSTGTALVSSTVKYKADTSSTLWVSGTSCRSSDPKNCPLKAAN